MNNASEQRLQLLYSDRWMARLKAFAARRYHDFGDWEGWFEEAHQNLALKFSNMPAEQAIDDALVFAVFKNELISVKRNRLGYPRPRAWLREFSQLGQDLFEWMCLQKLPRKRIIELAVAKTRESAYPQVSQIKSTNDSSADTGLASDTQSKTTGDTKTMQEPDTAIDSDRSPSHLQFLTELTDTMIQKKECDGVRPTTTDIDDESAPQLPTESPGTEESADHAQLSLVLAMLLGADKVTDEIHRKASDRLAGIRDSLKQESLLDDMDILILRCYYFQGLSQNDIAKQLGRPLQKIVRQREAAIRRIRDFMERHGFTRESFGF